MTKQPYGTVLIKADQILKYLSTSQAPRRLFQIVENTDLTHSTASKILNTLELIGYVQRDPETQEFSLGPSITRYANRSIEQMDIKKVAYPHLEKLRDATTETVHLGVLDRDRIIYIEKLESQNPVNLYSQVGKTIPLYCSAMGKAILAEQTDNEINHYLNENKLEKKTEQTITSKVAFREELTRIQNLGYAFDDAEHEPDIFCVGTSITLNGHNFGAFSVSVPKYRMTTQLLAMIIDEVQKCKTNILAEMHRSE